MKSIILSVDALSSFQEGMPKEIKVAENLVREIMFVTYDDIPAQSLVVHSTIFKNHAYQGILETLLGKYFQAPSVMKNLTKDFLLFSLISDSKLIISLGKGLCSQIKTLSVPSFQEMIRNSALLVHSMLIQQVLYQISEQFQDLLK